MSNYANALVVAGAIYAGVSMLDLAELESRVAEAVDSTLFSADEAKADLYAQLAERLQVDTPFSEAVNIVQNAMDQTERYLPGSCQVPWDYKARHEG